MLAKSRVKYIQTLGQKKFRDSERMFIAEGSRIIEDLLGEDRVVVREIFATEDWISNHRRLEEHTVLTSVSEVELKRMSQLVTPNKAIALIEQFEAIPLNARRQEITLVLDEIQDPGNLGTILRAADWFGVKQIICSPECADIYNSKVVQASMGSIARVHCWYTALEDWLVAQAGIRVYATAMDGESLLSIKGVNEAIIIIGNEGRGVHAGLLKIAGSKVTIPRKGKAESLNAGVATGILLAHFCLGDH